MKNKVTKEEKELKKVLNAEGGNGFFDTWVNQKCPSLGNKTPREVINEGQCQKILDLMYKVLKVKLIPAKKEAAIIKDNKVVVRPKT